MSDLIPFHFEAHEIRVHVDDAGEPWWEAQDVCTILDIQDVSKAVARLKLGEKRRSESRNVLIINEKGLYRLIFRSNKPEAERFQDWVYAEVLPAIRKSGRFDGATTRGLLPTTTQTLDALRACRLELEALGIFDDGDKIRFGAHIRRLADWSMRSVTGPGEGATPLQLTGGTQEPTLWTLSMRLQFLGYPPLRGADGDAHQIKIGTLAGKNYRAAYTTQTVPHIWDYVKGQQRKVNAYEPARVHILDDAIRSILGEPKLRSITQIANKE